MLSRRNFLSGLLATAVTEPIEEIRKTYSFIWTPPEKKLLIPFLEITEETRILFAEGAAALRSWIELNGHLLGAENS